MEIVSAKKVFNKMAIPQFISSISVKNDFEILEKEFNLSYVAVLLKNIELFYRYFSEIAETNVKHLYYGTFLTECFVL